MKLFKERIDVEFYIQSKPLTAEGHKEIGAYIKKSKAATAAREKRKAKLKAVKSAKE